MPKTMDTTSVTPVNFLEIAAFCREDVSRECVKRDDKRDYNILYAAVKDDDSLLTSCAPQVLSQAKRCILVHSWLQRAVSNYYDTYRLQTINEKGEVLDGWLDDKFSIAISTCGRHAYCDLSRTGETIFREKVFWDSGSVARALKRVWGLYLTCKRECKTTVECKFLCKLAYKEQTIEKLESRLQDSSVREELLEEELSGYRSLLNEIKDLIKDKNE